MTLIAAFWCDGDQAVLCADSLESAGDYKTSVTKIRPQELARGKYQIAYAGSGYGDLVDLLGQRLEEAFDQASASGWLSLQEQIAATLVAFYDSPEVKAYPVDPADANSSVSGVVCVRVVPLNAVFLFKFSKTIVLPVRDFVLRGFEAAIYSRIAKRLYHAPVLPLHAQLIGLRVLSEAASTSTGVDEPFRTVFAMTHGMFEHSRNTDIYLKALARVEGAMDDMLIACVDTHAVSDTQAKASLKRFSRAVSTFRSEHSMALKQEFKKHLKRPSGG